MKPQLFLNKVIVKKSSIDGYGVFADKCINNGEIVEECYVLIAKGGDDGMADYYFDADGEYGVLLGYGSIYNHSDSPNATYSFDTKNNMATIKAVRAIEKNEEIFITYGDNWFGDRGLKPKKPSIWRRILNPATSVLMRGFIGCALLLLSIQLIKMVLT
ncbi:MAG: SET domain-containing protein-lysine N-methyltransferase [Gammaproteobacteria bacterium]|nr:SET domain-containing protein-lysine N-methyltransferase [Gammaproteobacteria bacterium]